MLPFSKRPPPPEEYFLRSGDFEAVQDPSRPVIPSAPRQPVFARQAQMTPYSYVQSQNHGHYGDLSVPPPPNSLAPVAMTSEARHLASTGSHRGAPTVVVREKPSMKWGVMIALTGAILGGVLGIGMDARRQSTRAAASQGEQSAPVVVTPVAVAQPAPAMQIAAPVNQVAAPAPVVLPPAQPILVAPAPVEAKVDAKAAKDSKDSKTAKNDPKAKNGKTSHPVTHAAPARPQSARGILAMGVKPAAAEPKAAPEPAAAPEPKKAAEPAKKSAAPRTDAEKALADAIKDTTNTL